MVPAGQKALNDSPLGETIPRIRELSVLRQHWTIFVRLDNL